MKKILITALLSLWTVISYAQTNLSGTYGYSFKPEGNPPKEAVNAGPSGKLVLLRMENNTYRFWLDVTIGWPSYNVGETDGTIRVDHDTAFFDNTFEGATQPCFLQFRIAGNTININSISNSFNCGFGNGVTPVGAYTRLSPQPALNNQWLKKEYPEAPTISIKEDKAEIFLDENFLSPFTPKQYFVKGESMLGIEQTEKAVYTEFISSTGKFIYGWIKKSAVKFGKTE